MVAPSLRISNRTLPAESALDTACDPAADAVQGATASCLGFTFALSAQRPHLRMGRCALLAATVAGLEDSNVVRVLPESTSTMTRKHKASHQSEGHRNYSCGPCSPTARAAASDEEPLQKRMAPFLRRAKHASCPSPPRPRRTRLWRLGGGRGGTFVRPACPHAPAMLLHIRLELPRPPSEAVGVPRRATPRKAHTAPPRPRALPRIPISIPRYLAGNPESCTMLWPPCAARCA